MLPYISQKMPLVDISTTSKSHGNSSLISWCITPPKRTCSTIVLKISSSLLSTDTTVQSCAMDRLELVKHSPWMVLLQISSTEESSQELSLKCSKNADLTMIKKLSSKSVIWKFIMSNFTIYSLMSQEWKVVQASLFKMMLRVKFMSEDVLNMKLQMKNKPSTSYLKVRPKRLSLPLKWTSIVADLIQFIPSISRANLRWRQLRKLSTLSYILLI